MANTASISIGIQANSASATVSASQSFAPTLVGAHILGNVQNIGTAAEIISIVDVATLGYLYVKNLDNTNYVEISLDGATFGAGKIAAKLKAGEFCFIPAEPGVTYGGRANTAAVDCMIIAIEA